MNLQTFKAATMAQALGQVKASMGQDAVILHTRTYQLRRWMGLRRQEMVEITAGRGIGVGRGRRPAAAGLANPNAAPGKPASSLTSSGTWAGLRPGGPGGSTLGLTYGPGSGNGGTGGFGAASLPAKVAAPVAAATLPAKSVLDTPAGQGAALAGITRELARMRHEMETIATVHQQSAAPNVPDALRAGYHALTRHEVCPRLAEHLARTVHQNLKPEQLAQPAVVRDALATLIERTIPVAGPIARRPDAAGPHVAALVGPTGVGKTTTLAKLAAHLKLNEGKRVGLITLDTYRIAAVEQLKRYADIIGCPFRAVADPDEMRDAVTALADMQYVLIDTSGRSPNDAAKLAELRELLSAVKPDEVHLVLSCTSTQSCVDLAVRKFGEVRVDKVCFTKLDEAAHVGVVVNVAARTRKPLSYLTTGQDVPDNIEVASGRRLADRLLDGPPAAALAAA